MVSAIAVAFGVSFVIAPVFVSRYLVFTIPSLYLIITNLSDSYSPRSKVAARIGLIALMIITLGIEIKSAATPVKENYREAAEYLTQTVTPQDVVVVSAPFTVYPVEYYYRGPARLETIPLWNQYAFGPIPAFSTSNLPNEVVTLTANHKNLWLLLSYDQGYEETVRIYFDTHIRNDFLKKVFSSISDTV